MKVGSFSTIPRQSVRTTNGTLQKSPQQKKDRKSISRMKAMLIDFFDKNGVVHSELVPERQTVNGDLYMEVLKRSKEGDQKFPPIGSSTTTMLSLLLCAYRALDKKWHRHNSTATLYSPDLAPALFSLTQSEKRPQKAQPRDPG
ncbi:hypothetical protein TNCV_2803191 [Trichonephila clavipes]|nr:hypothetical protein TNCV_2803191 [Trichonephila clavipes]